MNLTLSIGKFSESLRCKHADQYSILKLLIIGFFDYRVQKSFCGMNKKLFLRLKKEKEKIMKKKNVEDYLKNL